MTPRAALPPYLRKSYAFPSDSTIFSAALPLLPAKIGGIAAKDSGTQAGKAELFRK